MATLAATMYLLNDGRACRIRSATPEDAEGVLECALEAFATSDHTLTKADEFAMTLEKEREFLSRVQASPTELFLIAEKQGAQTPCQPGDVLGVLNLRQPAPRRKVRHIVELGMSIRSSHRGVGLGSALLDDAIDWAEANPVLRIMTLGVYASNAAGLALYKRCGFVEYGRLPDGCIHDDGTLWEQLLMWRRLKAS
ncbi:MAG: N-acetyltransferase [Planctomycetota bacterium]|nr:N-acetyltransferase [Planctomycetota bacterium]